MPRFSPIPRDQYVASWAPRIQLAMRNTQNTQRLDPETFVTVSIRVRGVWSERAALLEPPWGSLELFGPSTARISSSCTERLWSVLWVSLGTVGSWVFFRQCREVPS
eukprot:10810456-Alexandrium_andersonii.AAC.1